MAVKTIELEHFRSQESAKYDVSQRTQIVGRNGAGKSSLKEALSFTFCGTDSVGTKNPQHLIRQQSDDKAVMKTKITTDRSVIQRSLSQKGNSTIKVIREGVPTTVTQSQLETMLGPTDVVLSAMIPGYFCQLSADRQTKALADILPPIDRSALFSELAGFDLTTEEKVRYGLTRRLDLVASSIAQDRRDIEKEMARKEGELKALLSVEAVPEPKEPKEIADLSRLNALKKEWDEYERRMRDYSSYKVRRDRIIQENESRRKQAEHLKEILKDLREVKEPDVDDISVDVQRLFDQKRQLPQKPSVLDLPSGDHCPSCGQTVGSKHRERVSAENQSKIEQYKKAVEDTERHNEEIQDKINQLYQKENAQKQAREEAIQSNKLVRQKIQRIEAELSGLTDQELPDIVEEPKAPQEHYDEDEHARAREVVEEYRLQERDHARFLHTQKRIENESSDIKDDIKAMKSKIERLMDMERVFKLMPQAEMERQASELKMPNITFKIGSNIEIFRNNIPYKLLSTGYQMRSDIEICVKFNSLMKRPMNIIFVDNVDLIDRLDVKDSPIQWFVAKVDESHEDILIEEF